MPRWAACVEYNGANYYGWQIQPQLDKSVQTWVQRALSTVANEPIEVVCAGRTDTGVHATTQIIHFDTTQARDARAFTLGANTRLPDDVSIIWAAPVSDEFHARFTARWRRYHYVIQASPTRPSIASDQVTHVHRSIDWERVARASEALVGVHDFTSLRSTQCQAPNPVREVHFARWYRRGELIVFDLQANAFLHHMVRNTVGTLLEIGQGKRSVDSVQPILDAKDRAVAGITAPPNGLHLVGVGYEPGETLPQTLRFPMASIGVVQSDCQIIPKSG